MFHKKLHFQPAGVQLAIFVFIWAAFFLLFSFLRLFFVKLFLGVEVLPDDWPARLLHEPRSVIFLNAFSALILFLVPSFLFTFLASPQPLAYLGLKKPLKAGQWVAVFILACGLVPILTGIGGWLKNLDLGTAAKDLEAEREAVFNTYFRLGGYWDLARNLFFLALVPAFCEEVFFRGLVQKFAFSWFQKQWAAIVFSGVVFALLHFSIYQFIPILMAGMVLAWVYALSGSLWLSVTVHFLNNGIQVILVFLAARFPWLETAGDSPASTLGIFALGLVLFLAGIQRLIKLKTPLSRHWSVVDRIPSPED